MQTLLKHWADALLEWLGLASAQDSGWDRWVAFTLVLLAVALFDFVAVDERVVESAVAQQLLPPRRVRSQQQPVEA